jgi:tetratricopeptide (TPR) repeat protein
VHQRAAARLRAAGGAPEQIAYDVMAAGTGQDAVPLLRTAARRAAAVGAYPDGQRWVEQALEHAPAADRGDLLELLGDLRHAVGDRRAARTYAAATDAAPRDRRVDLRIKHAQALNAAGDPTAGLEILRDLTATTADQQARLALTRGMIAWFAGDLRAASRHADKAGARLPDSERGALADLEALIAHSAGNWEDHAEWQLAEIWHVEELAGRVFDAYLCVTEYVLHSGDPYTRLAEFARRLRGHAHAAGARRGEAFATTVLGEVELLTGDAQAARAHLLEAVRLSRQVGAIGGEAIARARLGEAQLHLGERTAARNQLEEALALAHASSLADHLLPLIHGPLLRKCKFCSADYYVAAASVCARAGHASRAHAFLGRAEQAAGLWNGGPWAAAAAEARAIVLGADGDQVGATQALRRAIAGYSTAGQRLNEARARHALGERAAA